MSEILQNLILAVLGAIGAALGCLIVWAFKTYVLAWLKIKVESIQNKFIKDKVKEFMVAAEKKWKESGSGLLKSEWVIEQVSKLFPKINPEYIQTLIENLMKPLEESKEINS